MMGSLLPTFFVLRVARVLRLNSGIVRSGGMDDMLARGSKLMDPVVRLPGTLGFTSLRLEGIPICSGALAMDIRCGGRTGELTIF